MQVEQKLKRCEKYQIFLESDDNLRLFRKKYDIERFDLIIYIKRCQMSIENDIKLSRDEIVFLNELERCYQRVLKGDVKPHEFLEDLPQLK